MIHHVDPFLAQLAALCRELPTAPKWVFVPSRPIGHTLAERLAHEGTPWANLRFTLPLDLAIAMAAPALVGRGIDPAPEGLGPALVMRLLLDLPGSGPQYFRPLADQPEMADALWSTMRELRLAGLTAATLPADAFTVAEKHAELRALLVSYERYLAEHRLADDADVCRAALTDLDAAPIASGDVRLELPGVNWSPLERQLLDALPGRIIASRTFVLPGIPERPGSRCTPTPPAGRLAFLMDPAAAPAPHGDGTITMFRAAGREAEIEHVMRLIARDGRRLDDVEVVCTSGDDAALVWDKATRHAWPLTLSAGVPGVLTRPGRALRAFLAWAEEGFPAATLRRLLQSGDVKLGLEHGPSPGRAARLLAHAKATWGRGTYGPAFQALVQDLELGSADPELEDDVAAGYRQRAEHARQIAGVIQSLLALVPDGGNETRLGDMLAGARRFVARHAAVLGDLDAAAVKALDEALGELAVLDALSLPLSDAVRLLRERAARVRVGASRARPGALHVTSLAQAGYAGRSYTFVIGLEEGRVLPAALEDPVLLDDEREKLRDVARLPTSRDRLSEALQCTVARLAALGGHVCLSFSCLQVREGRETFPSWLVLQAHRLCSGRPDASYDDLRAALGDAVTTVPAETDAALDHSGWWLAALDGTGRTGVAAVEGAFPALRRGREAEAERESDRFTAWDGFVPAAGGRLDPRSSSRPLSPTGLEKIASCPFRHLLHRGLGLEPIEERVPDPDAWLDPGTRGTLLHEVFAEILRELRRREERVDPKRHGALARRIAEELIAKRRAELPPPAPHVYEREVHELLRDVDLFLRGEMLDQGREPIGFEVSFGTDDGDSEALSQKEPVTIDFGSGLRLTFRGRIDRVDRLAPGKYEIVDYKTGGFYGPSWTNGAYFAGGKQLQHALYALVAEQLLRSGEPGARVTRASYYFPSDRGGGERVIREVVPRQAVADVVRDLAEVVADGAFVHTPQDNDCSFCGMERACGRRAAQRAGLKIVNTANMSLAPYVRLRRHV